MSLGLSLRLTLSLLGGSSSSLLLLLLVHHGRLSLHVLDLLRVHLILLTLLVVSSLSLRICLVLHCHLLGHQYLLLMLNLLVKANSSACVRAIGRKFCQSSIPVVVHELGLGLELAAVLPVAAAVEDAVVN